MDPQASLDCAPPKTPKHGQCGTAKKSDVQQTFFDVLDGPYLNYGERWGSSGGRIAAKHLSADMIISAYLFEDTRVVGLTGIDDLRNDYLRPVGIID